MSTSSNTLKRLGVAGAAAAIGLVPVLATTGTASAQTMVGSAHLTLGSTAGGATTTATNTFDATTELNPSGGAATITIDSYGPGGLGSGDSETLPTASGQALGAPGDYTVSVAGIDETGTVTSSGDTATITLTGSTIAAGATVTVTVAGVTNPSSSSGVYFTDATSADTAPASTNSVAITGSAPVSGPGTVTQVNPASFYAGAADVAQPFTITGTGFSTDSTNSPKVCFVPSGSAIPSTASDCAVYPAGTVAAGNSGTEIQGTVDGLSAGTYNAVVYNYGGASAPTGSGGYYGPSATSNDTLVDAVSGLNFVAESGVRAVSTSSGLGVPSGVAKGPISSGSAEFFPLSDFEQSAAVPTNVPPPHNTAGASATGLSLNVTAVAPHAVGNLQVYPTTSNCTTGVPATSTVNFQNPEDTNNSTILGLSAGTAGVCVKDNGASVNVDLDVTGYTTGGFTGAQSRILDTRPGETDQANTGSHLYGPLTGNRVYSYDTGLTAGTTYAFNVTAVDPTAVGNLRVFPQPSSGAPSASGVPKTSVITYIPHTDASSLFVTTVGAGGFIDLYSNTSGSVNVIIDEAGTFAASSSLTALTTPYRIEDTRPHGITSHGTVSVIASPSGSGSTGQAIPKGAVGVVGDLGDINPTSVGYLATYPEDGVVPDTSAINNYPKQTRSTTAVVALNPTNGAFTIESVGSATNATFDATAYISGGGGPGAS